AMIMDQNPGAPPAQVAADRAADPVGTPRHQDAAPGERQLRRLYRVRQAHTPVVSASSWDLSMDIVIAYPSLPCPRPRVVGQFPSGAGRQASHLAHVAHIM